MDWNDADDTGWKATHYHEVLAMLRLGLGYAGCRAIWWSGSWRKVRSYSWIWRAATSATSTPIY